MQMDLSSKARKSLSHLCRTEGKRWARAPASQRNNSYTAVHKALCLPCTLCLECWVSILTACWVSIVCCRRASVSVSASCSLVVFPAWLSLSPVNASPIVLLHTPWSFVFSPQMPLHAPVPTFQSVFNSSSIFVSVFWSLARCFSSFRRFAPRFLNQLGSEAFLLDSRKRLQLSSHFWTPSKSSLWPSQ